jgi:hypothetical protein
MAALVTLERAKSHLKIFVDDENDDVQDKIEQASDIIVDYLKTDEVWTTEDAPKPVVTAVLLMLTHLYENRGEDMRADEAVWSAIRNVLAMRRAPTFA